MPSLVAKLSTTTAPDLMGLGPLCRSETVTTTTTANNDGFGVYSVGVANAGTGVKCGPGLQAWSAVYPSAGP